MTETLLWTTTVTSCLERRNGSVSGLCRNRRALARPLQQVLAQPPQVAGQSET